MISRKTLFSLLLTLLLAGGIAAWSAGRRDECSAWLAGDTRAPREMVVMTGDHRMVVGCDEWFLRQPTGVQVLCLADAAVGVVFLVSAWADRQRGRMGRLRG